jgi:hypothetical protein
MTTREEALTFMFAKGTYGAILAPKNKWNYGQLEHNIGWTNEDDCGTFLLDNGTVHTLKLKEVVKAYDRVVKGNCFSDIRIGLNKGKQQVAAARIAFEEGTLLGLIKSSQAQFRLGNPVKVPKKPVVRERPTHPVKTTKVAKRLQKAAENLPKLSEQPEMVAGVLVPPSNPDAQDDQTTEDQGNLGAQQPKAAEELPKLTEHQDRVDEDRALTSGQSLKV